MWLIVNKFTFDMLVEDASSCFTKEQNAEILSFINTGSLESLDCYTDWSSSLETE